MNYKIGDIVILIKEPFFTVAIEKEWIKNKTQLQITEIHENHVVAGTKYPFLFTYGYDCIQKIPKHKRIIKSRRIYG